MKMKARPPITWYKNVLISVVFALFSVNMNYNHPRGAVFNISCNTAIALE